MRHTSPIALTLGEPAGIGPDLIIKLADDSILDNVIIIADKYLLQARAEKLKLPFPPKLVIDHIPAANPYCCGTPDSKNVPYILETLKTAVSACLTKEYSALVTGPINKEIMNVAGIHFSGHTEYLAALTQVDKTVMLMQTEGLRVALATTHLPLAKVSAALTNDHLQQIILTLYRGLQEQFQISQPQIYICGLNPHAGEGGYLGMEEIDIIKPVIANLSQQGLDLFGPYPADTIFQDKYLQHADCILAMYHDQGLPVLKYKGFGKAVNITLGLPIIRTSVDHGTALDIAGTGLANPQSLIYAIEVAKKLRQHH